MNGNYSIPPVNKPFNAPLMSYLFLLKAISQQFTDFMLKSSLNRFSYKYNNCNNKRKAHTKRVSSEKVAINLS